MTARSERPGSPEDCDRVFAERVAAGDIDGLLALYEPDAQFVRGDGTIAQGHAELRTVLLKLTTVRTELRMHIARAIQHGDIAVIYNDWLATTTAADGTTAERKGKAIEVVRRQPDGAWLFAIDDPFGRDRTNTEHLRQRNER